MTATSIFWTDSDLDSYMARDHYGVALLANRRNAYEEALTHATRAVALDEKLAARFPIEDDPPFDFNWGNLRRSDGTSTKP